MTEALVSTQWVADNLEKVRLIEVDVDTSQYEAGRIPGALGFNWQYDGSWTEWGNLVGAPIEKS